MIIMKLKVFIKVKVAIVKGKKYKDVLMKLENNLIKLL